MSTPSGPKVTKRAPPPFDKAGADVILRSSDNVDFYVFRTVLVLASSFFETMFSLKQPPSDQATPAPVVDFVEDSTTIEALLRFCYPVKNPDLAQGFNQSDLFGSVLSAAIKYEMGGVVDSLREMLRIRVLLRPQYVFAIAAQHQLEEEAQTAANTVRRRQGHADNNSDDFTKTTAGLVFDPAYAAIGAGAYFRLLRYCRASETPDEQTPEFLCPPFKDSSNALARSAAEMAAQPPFDRQDSDVTLITFDGVHFHVHRLVLRFAGAGSLLDGVPPVYMSIRDDTLGHLLRLCYPSTACEKCPIDCARLAAVVDVATARNMEPLVRAIRSRWTELACSASDDLGMYLIAARMKWEKEAQQMASKLIDIPIDTVYSAELERTPAALYHNLLKYHHSCQVALRDAHKEFEHALTTINQTTQGTSWREGWFAGVAGRYIRSTPLVLAEAYDVRRGIDVQRLAQGQQKLEARVAAALKQVELTF